MHAHVDATLPCLYSVRTWVVCVRIDFSRPFSSPRPDLARAGFVELYRDGEVLQAVITCSFFFGSVLYGVKNQDNWEQVERLQHLVWAILSGTTCWLVTVLGQRVHGVSLC